MSTRIDASSRLAAQSMHHSDTHPVFDRLLNAWTDGEMRLVLIGRTGEGKSALANVLLGAKVFKTSCAMGSVTQECQTGKREFNGRNLLVIDTPGLFDTDKNSLSVAYEISKAVGISLPGPHAFIIVIKAGGGRYTREAEETVKLVHDIFGGDIVRYCIVVFTGEDNIRRDDSTLTLDRWLTQSTDSVISLVEACNGRCMAIDTTEKSVEQLDAKVCELMSMVNEMINENGGRIYTNEMLARAEQAYKEREEEMFKAQHAEEERRQREIDQFQQRDTEAQLEKERLSQQLEAAKTQSQQVQDALLATRLQAEEREKQVREQQAALIATHEKQQQRDQEAAANARDRNRETVKREEGGIWESLFKSAVPIISEVISKMYVDSGGISPNEPADSPSSLENHSSGGLLRQTRGRQDGNLLSSLTHHHVGHTGFRGSGASGSLYRHHHMVNSPSGRTSGPFLARGSGSHTRSGAGFFGGMGPGRGQAHHHHH